MNRNAIIVLTGASGSGKTTLSNQLSDIGIPRVVTTTTRKKREGEQNGEDYFFVTKQEMRHLRFIEQTIYNGNTYGLTVDAIQNLLDKNKSVCVALDNSGAKALKEHFPNQVKVIYLKVTKERMKENMMKRGDSQEKIEERLKVADETNELAVPEIADVVIKSINLQRRTKKIQEIVSDIETNLS